MDWVFSVAQPRQLRECFGIWMNSALKESINLARQPINLAAVQHSSGKLTTYAELNHKYFREADELLRKRDLPQASEKLWGAFVDAIKAVAEKRGQTLGTHRSVAQFVLILEKDFPGLGLHDAFRHAEGLHVNFFEDHLPEESVRLSADVVKDAVDKLRAKIPF